MFQFTTMDQFQAEQRRLIERDRLQVSLAVLTILHDREPYQMDDEDTQLYELAREIVRGFLEQRS